MFADVAGFSSVTQKDENKVVRLMGELTGVLQSIFQKFNGRLVKMLGDGFLVEFGSAVEAVNCAMEAQKEVSALNSSKREDERLVIRIGIHVGDVIHTAGDVVGDAVNIAARVQPLAESGGVCITRQVVDQVERKIGYRIERIGLRELKNIHSPVEIYRLFQDSTGHRRTPYA